MEVILQSHLSILECELRKRERYFAETFDGSELFGPCPSTRGTQQGPSRRSLVSTHAHSVYLETVGLRLVVEVEKDSDHPRA